MKDKGLRAKDTVAFNLCEFKNGTKENCNAFVIDVVKNTEVLSINLALNHEETSNEHEMETQEFRKAQPYDNDDDDNNNNDEGEDDDDDASLVPVWLFGKQIGWTEAKKAMEFK